jgi:hypothetical protein
MISFSFLSKNRMATTGIYRGSMEEDPDGDIQFPMAKIPSPKKGGTHDLMTAIVMLNMGQFDSEKDYAAFFYWDAVDKYVLLYRNPRQPWDTHYIELLMKSRDDSLNFLDTDKTIHTKIQQLIGLISGTKKKTSRKTRKSNQKTHQKTNQKTHQKTNQKTKTNRQRAPKKSKNK